MVNQEIAKIFYEIAGYLEMEEEPFKPQAYETAAFNLETLSEDAADIYRRAGLAGLKEISGVGQALAEKIEEYLKTGQIKEYQNLKKKMPVAIDELKRVEGVGPKMIKELYRRLKIKNLRDLEKAAKAGKIRGLPRFGGKTERNILQSIAFLKRGAGRFLLGETLPLVEKIFEELKGLKEVAQISLAGSIRRMKETIGDADILVVVPKGELSASDAKKVIDFFVALPGVIKIWSRGPTKASIRLAEGFDADLRVLPEKQFGFALQYFTGSKEHNIALRKIAIEKGLKLNEYGIFKGKKMLAGKTEAEVYKVLGLPYIEPELRENIGELEAAFRGRLPKIVGYKDLKGDLHAHSNWNGGSHSIEELAWFAREAMGYEYLGIADHTKFLRIEHGLDEKQLLSQKKEIDKLNKKFQVSGFKFQVFQGCEANIMADGSIDIEDSVLSQLDYVVAGIHSQMKMPREKMTARIIKAMRNPNVDIISHPTGRIIQQRDEYQIDFEKILNAAKETGAVLEINASPNRLDLKDAYIKKAAAAGVKMAINTDAHHREQMLFAKFGIAQARRGWAERKDIINCWPSEKLLEYFSKS